MDKYWCMPILAIFFKGSFIIYGTGGGGIRRSGRIFFDARFVVGENF